MHDPSAAPVHTLPDYVDLIGTAAAAMASLAETTPLATMTRTCPEWDLGALLRHQGEVHRFATAVLEHRCTGFRDVPVDPSDLSPADDAVADWLRSGAARLQQALLDAPDDVEFASFHVHTIEPRRLWWARRQANEIAVHLVDAFSAIGPLPTVPVFLSVDGIDEFLTGFVPRPRTDLHRDQPSRLRIAVDEDDRSWTVTVSPGVPVTVRDDEGPVDAEVCGPASDVYLALWNRVDLERVQVDGDRSLIEQLRGNVQIRWS